jgi:hypothetical protein
MDPLPETVEDEIMTDRDEETSDVSEPFEHLIFS